jgi:hypothetical protein
VGKMRNLKLEKYKNKKRWLEKRSAENQFNLYPTNVDIWACS